MNSPGPPTSSLWKSSEVEQMTVESWFAIVDARDSNTHGYQLPAHTMLEASTRRSAGCYRQALINKQTKKAQPMQEQEPANHRDLWPLKGQRKRILYTSLTSEGTPLLLSLAQ